MAHYLHHFQLVITVNSSEIIIIITKLSLYTQRERDCEGCAQGTAAGHRLSPAPETLQLCLRSYAGQMEASYLVNSVTPFRNQAELRYRDMMLLWKPLAALSPLLRFYPGPKPRVAPLN